MNIALIIKEMSIDEKINLLTGDGVFRVKGNDKYKIPSLRVSDGPYGVRVTGSEKVNTEGGTVCYPTGSALASSWNDDLAYEIGEAIAKDCKNEGINVILGPGVNMKRTPHCGRNFEYFSEDPYLAGNLAANLINGVESKNVGTTLKHFAVNNQEVHRNFISANVDEVSLREYYLKAFEIALNKSKPGAVMCAYNKLNGFWCSENDFLLKKVLREEWKYEGMVISDWGAVHNDVESVKAGMDLQMPEGADFVRNIKRAYDNGEITEEEIDRAVYNVLTFIEKYKDNISDESYDRTMHHELARKVAAETITLLKNENNILPLSPDKAKKIAVIGNLAQKPLIMGYGSSRVTVEEESIDSPLEYIEKYADEIGLDITYIPFFRNGVRELEPTDKELLVKIKEEKYDEIIVFIGNDFERILENEAIDRRMIRFEDYFNAAIYEMCNMCDKVVVVMQTGGATIPQMWQSKASGIVQMWFSGEGAGKAIADILFGKINPSGKLSETFILAERNNIDYPGNGMLVDYREGVFCGYRYYDTYERDNVWFPFGHGISYTDFQYSCMTVKEEKNGFNISFEIKNVGKIDGKEIAQLYIKPVDSQVLRAYKELKGYKKIEIQSGETVRVEFNLPYEEFEYYNINYSKRILMKGKYELCIGASSADIRLMKTVEVV